MISIIIPTLNEENYLPHLISSIKKQGFFDLEIIVADAGSRDKTVSIAQSEGIKITKGGPPPKGRNEGEKLAKSDLLLFLDADLILPEKFLEKVLKEFEERKLDIASFCLGSQIKSKGQQFLFNLFYNWPTLILEKFLAHATQAVLVKREIFEKIGGFDEEIKFAEDHNFVRRAKKFGNFGIIRSTRILGSSRRFKRDGWVKTYLKYLFAELYMIFVGDIKKDIFKYEFGEYNSKPR